MTALYTLTMILSLLSPTAQKGFQDGLDAYWKRDLAAAVEHFETVSQAVPTSAGAWYNYGTVLAESGKTGMAVYAFERALRLAPGHEDAQLNLSRTKTQAIERFSETEQEQKIVLPTLERGGESLFRRYRKSTLNWLFGVCWFLYFVAFWCAREGGKTRLRTLGFFFSLVFFLFSAGIATLRLGRAHWVEQTQTAIVIENMGIARQGPGAQYRQQTRILGGAKVKVLGAQAPWTLIEYSNGRTAWIEESSIRQLPTTI